MLEIEHKFLVTSDAWRTEVQRSCQIVQGYFNTVPEYSLRVRIIDRQEARLTLKQKSADPLCRLEYEYPIPVSDGMDMLLRFCGPRTLVKIRHYLEAPPYTWEIDEFLGANAGLVVAELELPSVDAEFTVPPWIGADVTADPRYKNINLVRQPFSTWP